MQLRAHAATARRPRSGGEVSHYASHPGPSSPLGARAAVHAHPPPVGGGLRLSATYGGPAFVAHPPDFACIGGIAGQPPFEVDAGADAGGSPALDVEVVDGKPAGSPALDVIVPPVRSIDGGGPIDGGPIDGGGRLLSTSMLVLSSSAGSSSRCPCQSRGVGLARPLPNSEALAA